MLLDQNLLEGVIFSIKKIGEEDLRNNSSSNYLVRKFILQKCILQLIVARTG